LSCEHFPVWLQEFRGLRRSPREFRLRIAPPPPSEATDLSEFILSRVTSKGGSISAEHAIGEDKASYLQRYKSQEELDLMRELKQLLDPLGIMNPRKVPP
jgi:FAD/FMN-containing dehydrogenase